MVFVEIEHGARTMAVDLVHAHFCFLAVLEDDICNELAGGVFLYGFDLLYQWLPILLFRCP